MTALIIITVRCVFMLVFLLTFLPLLIWAERKGAAYIQDRPGPNRADVFGIRLAGLIQPIADVVKLLFKEDVTPRNVYQPFYKLAPIIAMTVALVTFVVVPLADHVHVAGMDIPVQVSDLDTGLLYVFAVASLGVYGIMLAGWSSNNKYALLGGLRSSAQMVSYEIAMGLAAAAMFLLYGTAQLDDMVRAQGANPLHWGVVSVPGLIAFILFLTASFAEANRNPFDLPEGESGLVAGYHVEYSAFKFAMFFMAEYVNMVVASGLVVTLFFGGYQIPFLSTDTILTHGPLVARWAFGFSAVVLVGLALFAFSRYRPGRFGDRRDREPIVVGVLLLIGAVAAVVIGFGPGLVPGIPGYDNRTMASLLATMLQIGMFAGKVAFFAWLFIWVRWTLPRFRYDQLMRLGWNYLLPIGIFNLVLAGVWVVVSS